MLWFDLPLSLAVFSASRRLVQYWFKTNSVFHGYCTGVLGDRLLGANTPTTNPEFTG
ncbi:hypothetical protein J0895_14600 [Phormidium pseudopriestleyi FRX01]|uniref:Uncharacterized protein n=1 Tax=Phormidium pseudopriestleyi FRX01 TaxID=1759528 RepID=A0ABS3FT62_9CYAN|nr:hypothetical protein [Phormidium pseudopriestleyi]MBO0350313.1 hypothetical protein [Phormidium pseudopriestleyi FRX01]